MLKRVSFIQQICAEQRPKGRVEIKTDVNTMYKTNFKNTYTVYIFSLEKLKLNGSFISRFLFRIPCQRKRLTICN